MTGEDKEASCTQQLSRSCRLCSGTVMTAREDDGNRIHVCLWAHIAEAEYFSRQRKHFFPNSTVTLPMDFLTDTVVYKQ